MPSVLLTIAVPTYNRAQLLNQCLSALAREFENDNRVEIIVSNNASTDNTVEVVEQHRNAALPGLHYFQNEQNLGPDLNIRQCFDKAKGKYVWIFSDDDFLLSGYGAPLLALLAGSDWGVVHLKGLWYDADDAPVPTFEPLVHRKFEGDGMAFVREITYWVTFITGNIVNKAALFGAEMAYKFVGTNLVQLGWVLPAIFSGRPNVLVSTPVIACRANNTGGYKLFETFATSFNTIMRRLVTARVIPAAARDAINQALITGFFPPFILSSQSAFSNESILQTLGREFWNYPAFWVKLMPVYFKNTRLYKSISVKKNIKNLCAKLIYKILHSQEYRNLELANISALPANFRHFGLSSNLPKQCLIKNPQYISIGDNFSSLYNLRLEAWDEYAGQSFKPSLVIGDNVNINTDCHIGCIERVEIGRNVLIASRVYISDHSHGDISAAAFDLPPVARPLRTKGPVIIEDNVWIGEGVCVMPGVRIGKNAIIGANAVVTKNIPANSVAAGVPAKVVRYLA